MILRPPISNRLAAVGLAIVLAIILYRDAAIAAKHPKLSIPHAYVINSNDSDYASTLAIFASVGFKLSQCGIGELPPGAGTKSILIVPHDQAVKLSKTECALLTARVRSGDALMTDGISELSKSLGISFAQQRATTKGYLWSHHGDVSIAFPKSLHFDAFKVTKRARTLANDVATGRPVAVCGRLGKGNYFYSGIPLAPTDGSGYEHFPFILETVRDAFFDHRFKP